MIHDPKRTIMTLYEMTVLIYKVKSKNAET